MTAALVSCWREKSNGVCIIILIRTNHYDPYTSYVDMWIEAFVRFF